MTHLQIPHDDSIAFAQAEIEESRLDDPGSSPVYQHRYTYDDLNQFRSSRLTARKVWLVALVLEILIGFRIFLKMIAANPDSGFARFVYGITEPFLMPFYGLTWTPEVNGAYLEFSSMIAMVVYAILFWLAIYAARLFSRAV